MIDPETCKHHNFAACVSVNRILPGLPGDIMTPDESAAPVCYYAEISVNCVECGTPFHFVGVPGGLSPRAPHVDPCGLELRAPIKPGALLEPIRHSVFEMATGAAGSDADVSTESEN